MPRICRCDRLPPPGEPYATQYCRLCWLWHHDPRYQELWGPDDGTSPPKPPPKLLGDVVESALSSVGITKEKVEQWLGRPCGCKERQERLNSLHVWARDAVGSTAEAARGLLHKLIG